LTSVSIALALPGSGCYPNRGLRTVNFDRRSGDAPSYRSGFHTRRLRPVSSAQRLQRAHRRHLPKEPYKSAFCSPHRGRDIGPIIVTARRRRPITAVPTIIAAVPRRVPPHHHRRAPMLDMRQGTARMRAGATTCRGGAIAGRIIGAGVTTRRGGAIAARLIGVWNPLWKGATGPP
jgi:hypothetical protein